MSVSTYVPTALSADVATELDKFYSMGMTSAHVAYTLQLLADEKTISQQIKDRVDLVWTGYEEPGTESRDTSVVAQELFNSAQYSVIIASYAVDKGNKGQEIFQSLASRMDAIPNLSVRMFLNVKRNYGSNKSEVSLLKEFAKEFRTNIWPGQRLPEVLYFPQALSKEYGPKACLHAKCIIIDEARLLVTSANLTEAAHHRNLEAGVLLADPVAARAMRNQFEMLVSQGILRPIPDL